MKHNDPRLCPLCRRAGEALQSTDTGGMEYGCTYNDCGMRGTWIVSKDALKIYELSAELQTQRTRAVFVIPLGLFCIGLLAITGAHLFRSGTTQEAPAEQQEQPIPANIRVSVEDIEQDGWTRKLIRWVDCETYTLCYGSAEGFDCVPHLPLERRGDLYVQEVCDG